MYSLPTTSTFQIGNTSAPVKLPMTISSSGDRPLSIMCWASAAGDWPGRMRTEARRRSMFG